MRVHAVTLPPFQTSKKLAMSEGAWRKECVSSKLLWTLVYNFRHYISS